MPSTPSEPAAIWRPFTSGSFAAGKIDAAELNALGLGERRRRKLGIRQASHLDIRGMQLAQIVAAIHHDAGEQLLAHLRPALADIRGTLTNLSGLQTTPVMARIVESLIAGRLWPVDSVSAEDLSPTRFLA